MRFVLASLSSLLIFLLSAADTSYSKDKITEDFIPVCDSLDRLIKEKTSVKGKLGLRAVMKRGDFLDFYFTASLSDIPWKYGDYEWFAETLETLMPAKYGNYKLGQIYSSRINMSELPTGNLGFDGRPSSNKYEFKKTFYDGYPIVENADGPEFHDGLEGRHIALWSSHGLYFDQTSGIWQWQRPRLFQSVEDLLSVGFVIPYLVPMLENAGAYVMLPRERDFNRTEIIIDNDNITDDDNPAATAANDADAGIGYTETGTWESIGRGFSNPQNVYSSTDNPFTVGTARITDCIASESSTAEAVWSAEIPSDGEYAVYISYKSFPNSSESAHYTVSHSGGNSEFFVNQKMGGGTWIYLGTFEFKKGGKACITLDNLVPENREYISGSLVCADAVKIGGGMGNIARKSGKGNFPVYQTSGMPRFTEGARYWLQWAGADSTVYSHNKEKNDYRDDLFSRGDWANWLSGGSTVNPDKDGKNIPIDLVFALHTDAGIAQNDTTIGTLAIYTLESEGKRKLPSGEDRRTNREYADLVQSQIVNDIRSAFDPEWNRRGIWNRGYRESRTPDAPSMLCELLSHQNFSDMKLAQDPSFRFCVGRAIYKGILKYLSNRYNCNYVVQPLPIRAFSVNIDGNKAILKWQERKDRIEYTAAPTGFIIQTRIDDNGFDNGMIVNAKSDKNGDYRTEIDIEPGHIYSFKITAYNSGGKSFPSEILSAGIPSSGNSGKSGILIVNNFTRVSAPAWFDSPSYAGFDNDTDSGVPYVKDVSFTGEMYDYDRSKQYISNDSPGFGASHNDMSGSVIAGNTFDYTYIHGKAIMACGYSFCSSGAEAYINDSELRNGKWCTDLICGKQVRTISGKQTEPAKYPVFPKEMLSAIRDFSSQGGNIIVSGAYIGTDIWSNIFPIKRDSISRTDEIRFAEKTLGFKWVTDHASKTGKIRTDANAVTVASVFGQIDTLSFNNSYDSRIYRVENPDGISPANRNAGTFLRYTDTGISAGTYYDSGTYGTICLGFPIETIRKDDDIISIFSTAFQYFRHIQKAGSD